MSERPIKLLVATHVHESVTPAYCSSLALLSAKLAQLGVPFAPALFKDSDVSRGRNEACAAAIEGGFSHLIFIDADIEFESDEVLKLLAAGKELCGASYRRKNDADDYNHEFIPNESQFVPVCPETGLLEVMRLGTGFLLIDVAVLEKMRDTMPEIHYKQRRPDKTWRNMWAFFAFEVHDTPGGRQLFSEDYNFCERWRKLGGKIWMDHTIKLGHWGAHCWQGDLSGQLEPGDGWNA